jgi:asparagine synthase (glutamine-hydrolysing)
MCAIFGWFGSDSVESLHRMADTMRHRGPDGDGYLQNDTAAIGMTRLSIIDLENGQQPFHSSDKNISIVCNGEIYNFQDLKQQLNALGHTFHTRCDCEIIPAAYQQWGLDFLHRLNGMFSIAIYDHQKKKLLLARDRCGQKPLYYAKHKGNIYFASEIRALHKIGVPKALNQSAIPAYLSLRYVPEPDTMFEGINILPAGSHLTLDHSTTDPQPEKWYHLPSKIIDYSDPVAELNALTQSSIHSALQSDVPIALHLSAGIDSGVLLAEIQKSSKPIQAITAGFGAHSDEVSEAASMCEKFQVSHTPVYLNPDDISSLPKVVSQMELPVGDALIIAFDRLAKTTSDIGCKVAIGGEGIDEIFAGYSFHKFMQISERLGSIGRAITGCALGLSPVFLLDKLSSFPADLGHTGKQKIQNYLLNYHRLSDYEKGINLRTLFSASEITQLGFAGSYQGALNTGNNLLKSHLKYQFDGWLQDWSIIRQERNTMAHSVEYRMPFLDHHLLEFGFSLKDSHKISGLSGKHIWRKMAAKYYPETQHKRAKQPFFFPTEEPKYYSEIVKLLDSTIGTERFQKSRIFDTGYIQKLRMTAEKTREFLPIKQLLSIAILDLWMQEHDLYF